MTGTRWTTPEQLDFLMARRTDFLEANVKKTRSDFYLDVFTDWFKRWPLLASMFPGKAETELDAAELERYQKALSDKKSQISSWFRRLLRDGAPKSTKVDKVVQELLELLKAEIDLQKVSRKMQHLEIYQVLFDEKINRAVKEECIAAAVTNQSQRMSIRRRLVQELFEKEPPSVRQNVEDRYQAQEDGVDIRPSLKTKNSDIRDQSDENEATVPGNSPDAYQIAIDASTSLLLKMMTICSQKTKWTYHCMMGGEVPKKTGSRVCMEHYAIGGPTTSAGLTFPQAYKMYDIGILSPFSEYLYETHASGIQASESQFDVRAHIGPVLDITKSLSPEGLISFDKSIEGSANDGTNMCTEGTNTPQESDGTHMRIGRTDTPAQESHVVIASSHRSANGDISSLADLPPALSYNYSLSMDGLASSTQSSPPTPSPPSSPLVFSSLPPVPPTSPAPSSPPPVLPPVHLPEIPFSQQVGGPTEPLQDAINRMNAETDLRYEMERSHHFDNNVLDPLLRGEGPGNIPDSNPQSNTPTLERNNPLNTGTAKDAQAKRPRTRRAKTTQGPGPEGQTQEERRTSSRTRKAAPLRPMLVADPSKPPNRGVKPGWYYEEVVE